MNNRIFNPLSLPFCHRQGVLGRKKEPMSHYHQTLELIFKSLHLEPEKEYRFHKTRRWRIDYAFPAIKLAVEYEGMAYNGGKSRHSTITGMTGDMEKYNELVIAGWKLIRVNAQMITSGMAYDHISRIMGVTK